MIKRILKTMCVTSTAAMSRQAFQELTDALIQVQEEIVGSA